VAKPDLILFFGRLGDGRAQALVQGARLAATLDTVDAARQTGAFDRMVIATDAPDLFWSLPAGVELDSDSGPHHFGQRLAELVQRLGSQSVLYLGGGSLPLIGAEELAAIVGRLASEQRVVVSNNPFSSDLVGWRPANTMELVAGAASDNALARLLAEAGLAPEPLPRNAVTQFDIDSPTDLAILKLAGRGGPRLQAWLATAEIEVSRYQRLLPVLTQGGAQLLVAGRVGAHVVQYLQSETACRTRIFSEERGMVADGRQAGGQAHSLLALYIEEAGIAGFFRGLAQLCDAAIIDTRVLLSHRGDEPGAEDRFLSDMGRWQDIRDPFLRDFTRAACESKLPVLLGGHSLVAGGLMLLVEHAWQEHDRAIAVDDKTGPSVNLG
jgi:hypothetical protein